ncbi:MAG TPA: biotin/lipoyl-containing protein [Micromonosporaceae bacterium]|jgi:2-oxoglutarate dehydrogenase E2 component (dihydrolipoamide succinyltransferase)
MMVELRIPQAGSEMEEGELAQWLVPSGSRVEEGQSVYVLATDKVEMEVEAPATGILHHVGEVGRVYVVGTVIGHIDTSE